jgi:hypothetical protein
VAYLLEHNLTSNVEISQVAPVDWKDLKGVDDVIRALQAKIALPRKRRAGGGASLETEARCPAGWSARNR